MRGENNIGRELAAIDAFYKKNPELNTYASMTTPPTTSLEEKVRERFSFAAWDIHDNVEVHVSEIVKLLASEREEATKAERARLEIRGRRKMNEMYETVDKHKRIRSEGTRERVKILMTALYYSIFMDDETPLTHQKQ